MGKDNVSNKRTFVKKTFVLPLVFIALMFALCYFCAKLLHMPYGPFDLETSFDRKVPFLPGFIYVYIFSYVYWLASFIMLGLRDRKAYYGLIACVAVTYVTSLIIYIFLPTTIIRPDVPAGGLTAAVIRFIYAADSPPLNLFPSMHCLASWMCFEYTRHSDAVPKAVRIISFVSALAVFASTQLVKQHYIADVFGGILLAEAGIYAVRKMKLGDISERLFSAAGTKIFGSV